MGDENTPLSATDAQHLVRRTGFGALPKAVADLIGPPLLTRGEAADMLLDFDPSRFKPRGRDIESVHNRWVKYMIGAKHPIQEKLVLFWHDHFATSNVKVDNVKIMTNQNGLLRQFCKGNFQDFVKAINKDAAMMEFLDTVRNDQDQPNENYGRELQELFTLGVKDLAGNANYVQADVAQIARAFTGWRYNDKGVAFFDDNSHDHIMDWPLRGGGTKAIYKTTGGFGPSGSAFDANGEGAQEIDTVIDIIFQHKDTNGKSTVARYIAKKLLTYFANSTPATADIDQVITDSGFDTAWDIQSLVRAILVNDAFYATAALPPYTGTSKKSVKWPVDFAVSTLRLLGMKLASGDQHVNYSSYRSIRDYLSDMGQVLLEPPSVFGWDWETAWVSSSTLLARYTFVKDVMRARGNGHTAFRPEKLTPIATLMTAGPALAQDIVDTVTDILGVKDYLTSTERTALITYMGGTGTMVDLNDYDTRNSKLNGLFGQVLQSPAYQLQ